MTEATCGTCPAWGRGGPEEPPQGVYLPCRMHSPPWHTTQAEEWCMEHPGRLARDRFVSGQSLGDVCNLHYEAREALKAAPGDRDLIGMLKILEWMRDMNWKVERPL